ncbi:hypothetical protein HanRHA438_Chr14g0678061 [Helianthus annuus]|nr:hypothetical protein HanRHA438_Chr14g0678061 [Helianthus annuus]
MRDAYALFLARPHASRRGEDGRESKAETACNDDVWAWQRRWATDTASSKACTASGDKHCLAVLTGVGMVDCHHR